MSRKIDWVRTTGVVLLLTWTSIASAQLMCNRGYNCGRCNGGQAYAKTGPGPFQCVPCLGVCIPFLTAEPDPAAGSEIEGTFVPFHRDVSLALTVAPAIANEIAARNVWAAKALVDLAALGAQVDIMSGQMRLGELPSAQTVALAAKAERDHAAIAANTRPLPANIDARVGWSLTRVAQQDAELKLWSFVADRDGRVLYKPYPDVIVRFIEQPLAMASRVPSEKDTPTRAFVLDARSWHVAD